MGTLSNPLTGLAQFPNPGSYIEVQYAKGEMMGDPSVPRVLLIGMKTAAGSATADTQVYPIGTVQDAIDLFGTGSTLHRGARRFADVCKGAQVFGLAVTEGGGTAATNTITIAGGNPSASGSIAYTYCGESITVPFASGAAFDTVVAEDLKSLINLQTHWPITAARVGGVVTITYKHKGIEGNAPRQRVTISSGVGTTAVCATEQAVNGATIESWTTALATILADNYDFIVPLCNITGTSDTRIGALKTQVVSQALPVSGIRQQVIFGHTGSTAAGYASFSAEATNGPGNHPRFRGQWQKASEWEPLEIAAHMAAVYYNKEKGGSPWYNYDGYGSGVNDVWNIPKPYSQANYPTAAEISTVIAGGGSPIATAPGGRTYLVQSCTCSTDIRVRDTNKVSVPDKFAADLAVRYHSQWQGASLQDDPINDNDQPPPNSLTPSRLKGLTIAPLYLLYSDSDHGWLESDKTRNPVTGDIKACQTGIDPVNKTRANAKIPLHVTPCAHVFAALVTENSAA